MSGRSVYEVRDSAEVLGLVRELLRTRRPMFVATAVSPWHALGVQGALLEEIPQWAQAEGIVIIRAHEKGGFLVTPDDFRCMRNSNVTYLLETGSRTPRPAGAQLRAFGQVLLATIVSRARHAKRLPIMLIAPLHVDMSILHLFSEDTIRRTYRPRIVLTDEGIGSYASTRMWIASRRLNDPGAQVSWMAEVRYAGSRLMAWTAERAQPTERRALFTRTRKGLVPVEEIASAYRTAIHASCTPIVCPAEHPFGMVLTQALSEYGIVSPSVERLALREVVLAMWKAGCGVIVKPHPEEAVGKYSGVIAELAAQGPISLADSSQSAEFLYAPWRPDCVVGYGSTGLLTAAALFSIPALDASELLRALGGNRGNDQSIRWFRRMAGKMVQPFDTASLSRVGLSCARHEATDGR